MHMLPQPMIFRVKIFFSVAIELNKITQKKSHIALTSIQVLENFSETAPM